MDSASMSDRNLLFGIVAVQMDFLSPQELGRSLQAWTQEPDKSLGQLLEERGQLNIERRQLLDALVKEHLRQHGDDAVESLRALHCPPSLKVMLKQLDEPALQASLAHALTEGWDQYATCAPAAAQEPMNQEEFSTAPPPAGTPVVTVGHFQVMTLHARGGLGEVFVARDDDLKRQVALKRIQLRHADEEQSRTRFLREAEITAGLEHPGIVPVYGLGHYASGHPFYAMRFIQGESLKDAIERFHKAAPGLDLGARELLVRRLLRHFVDVCEAIEYAHSRGILHRDLKPSNVMLGRYGETLVVDWGLAKHLSSRDGEPEEEVMLPASEASMTETLPGAALGTPQYMSPEQAAGRLDELGTRSDIYGLGASLYHLLTGRAPFDGAELHVLLEQVRTGRFKRPRQVRRSLPRPLEEVCLKAMALRPEDRYASAQELAEDIERWLADEPVTAYEEPGWQQMRRWIRRHALQVGLGSIVAFAVLVSWFAYLAFESTVNSSREALIEGTQESNRFAAQFVASSISWQINQRFDMLEDVSRSNRMRLLVAAAAGQDRASPERQALQRQLERVRKEYDSVLGQGSEIWSIYDDRGFQVARSPLPTAAERDTIGENFAYRDYFHHRGRDLPRGSDLRDVQPYRSRLPYISSIHRETVSERWVVPFSIAIWDSDEPGAKVIGVLTMAVFLGGFGELRNYNGPQFATLVNLGPDEAGGRGLILQHPDLVASSAQYYIDPNSEQTLQHLATTMYRLQQEGRPASEALRAPTYLAWSAAYRDPVGHIIPLYAGEWMAEAWPVFINLPNHERINTGWVVIIQEPRDGALKPIRTLRQELIQLGLLALGLLLLLVAVIYAAVALFSRRRATPPKAIH